MKEAITIISIISTLSINLFKATIEQSQNKVFPPSTIINTSVDKDVKEDNQQKNLSESREAINTNINDQKIDENNIDHSSTLQSESTYKETELSSKNTNKEDTNIPTKEGFNYLGNHYDLGYFSGTGFVPTWTNTVFQWNDFPKHYLVELNSYPGQTIFGLQIGSEVTVNGNSYTVYDIVYNQANDQEGLDMVLNSEAAISIKVCVSSSDNSALNLYFLK